MKHIDWTSVYSIIDLTVLTIFVLNTLCDGWVDRRVLPM